MHVLITRPREDAMSLADRLRRSGVESTTESLLEIIYGDTELPDLSGIQGLLITSANGIRAFSRKSSMRDMTVWAVGDASARAAKDLEFQDVRSASGDVAALAALVSADANPAKGALLHVAGARLAGDLAGLLGKARFTCQRSVLYEARMADHFSDHVLALFATRSLDGVLLFSPRTAELFGGLVSGAAQLEALGNMTAFCLSPSVVAKIDGLPWGKISVATDPTEASLIAEVLEMASKV